MRWPNILTLVLTGLLGALPAHLQEPPSTPPKLAVTVGKALMLDSAVKIKRVAASTAELIESIAIGPREVLINGKLPGETSLVVWLENDQRLTYDLTIRPSPNRLNAVREQIARDLPGNQIDVTLDNDTAFVRGRVKDVVTADLPMEQLIQIQKPLSKTVTTNPKQ